MRAIAALAFVASLLAAPVWADDQKEIAEALTTEGTQSGWLKLSGTGKHAATVEVVGDCNGTLTIEARKINDGANTFDVPSGALTCGSGTTAVNVVLYGPHDIRVAFKSSDQTSGTANVRLVK